MAMTTSSSISVNPRRRRTGIGIEDSWVGWSCGTAGGKLVRLRATSKHRAGCRVLRNPQSKSVCDRTLANLSPVVAILGAAPSRNLDGGAPLEDDHEFVERDRA